MGWAYFVSGELVEGILVGYFILQSGKARWKRLCLSNILFGGLYATVVSVMRYQPPIVITSVQMTLVVIGSFLIIKENIAYTLLISSLTLLGLLSIQYLVRYICAVLSNGQWFRYYQIINLSLKENVQILSLGCIALLEFLTAVFFRHKIKQLHNLNIRFSYIIAMIVMAGVMIMNFLFNSMDKIYSPAITQSAIASALIFMITAMFSIVIIFKGSSTIRNDNAEKEMLRVINRTIEDAYQQVIEKNTELRKQAHDFSQHLNTIRNMAKSQSDQYIDALLKTSSINTYFCYSGDPYIDAVINSKMQRIRDNYIRFEYHIGLPDRFQISPADICTIISNQLENAIEACQKIEELSQRWIELNIDQRGGMIAIVCKNSIIPRSITIDALEKTSKNNEDYSHGYGIRNIRTCAERCHGVLVHDIEGNCFSSRVLLSTDYVT